MKRINCSGCYCDCRGCVLVGNPCPGPSLLPISGSFVEILEAGTSTVLASGTTGTDGKACDLPGGSVVDIRLSKAGFQTIRYSDQTLPCGGTLTLQQKALGYVRCWGFTCSPSHGRVPTTYTFTRSGFPSVTAVTGSSGYVDVYLPAAGTWSRTATATDFQTWTGNFNFNNSCGTFTIDPTFFGGLNTAVAGKFCGCSPFARSPHPFSNIATVTDCGGSTAVNIEGNGLWCGINSMCVTRTLPEATAVPTRPNSYCFDNVSTFRRQLCGTMPLTDKAARNVKINMSIFASQSSTPTGSQTSPQLSATWNFNCKEDDPPGSGGIVNCSPPDNRSETFRDGRWTCADITVGGASWSSTGYTVHSYDPPVVELHFDQTPDFAQRAGSTPPPGGPPCPSIILSVVP